MESYCLIVQRSVGDDAKVPEIDSDNGWTTFWMYLMLQNYSLKNENIIMLLYIYIFYCDLKCLKIYQPLEITYTHKPSLFYGSKNN